METGICIIAGVNKDGETEPFGKLHLKLGDTVSIVGPTGSGKTAFITDIELLSQGDSITKRIILVDEEIPSDEIRYNPVHKPVVMITQNTKCFSDLYVEEFLGIHARARGINDTAIVNDTLNLANKFAGEKIRDKQRVNELSGGQTRSLLFADAIKIGKAPIVLLDEIENAGINKQKIIDSIRITNKLIIYVTHDPIIALQTNKRIVIGNGSIRKIIERNDTELNCLNEIIRMDSELSELREKIRTGELIDKIYRLPSIRRISRRQRITVTE